MRYAMPSAGNLRPRKAHRKSRRGCIECKRRHVKCDEGRPGCVNCDVSRRTCSYEDMASKPRTFIRVSPQNMSRSISQPSPSPATSPRYPNSASLRGSPTGLPDCNSQSPPMNKFHLELFHHFITHLWTFLCLDHTTPGYASLELTRCILGAPFLINGILAFAALHLSVLCPAGPQQDFYRHHATQLQTHALEEYNASSIDINNDTCIPVFLFTSILAIHTLVDNLIYRADDFDTFLDDFVQCLRLYRGVRAVADQSWDYLAQSSLKALVEAECSALAHQPQGQDHCRPECSQLQALINPPVLDPFTVTNTITISLDTINSLEAATDAGHGRNMLHKHNPKDPSPSSCSISTLGPVISWLATVSPSYIDLLAQRNPEALTVLGHFGALLHFHRGAWTFGDSGAYIVSSVVELLGADININIRLSPHLP
ncbi:Zn(II)2Cys6 transcription factor domain-containing protein [Aspergillus undulatus]|uniref:Zn(II)2Cys6 transcription factor domain-containing protein n=1 Tax=Aspergillus undulatus TaxID=1810928 RepID=UPI003CCE35B5